MEEDSRMNLADERRKTDVTEDSRRMGERVERNDVRRDRFDERRIDRRIENFRFEDRRDNRRFDDSERREDDRRISRVRSDENRVRTDRREQRVREDQEKRALAKTAELSAPDSLMTLTDVSDVKREGRSRIRTVVA